MIRRFRVRIIAAAAAAALFSAAPCAVYAGTNEETQVEIMQAAKNFQDTLQTLESSYYAASGETCNVESLYVSAMRGMMDGLDPWTSYFTPDEWREFQAGLTSASDIIGIVSEPMGDQYVVQSVVDNSPAQEAGIQPGDEIVQIAGTDINADNMDSVPDIIAAQNGTFNIVIMRNGVRKTFAVKRSTVAIPSVSVKKVTDVDPNAKAGNTANIRYVHIESFSDTTGEEFAKALASMKQQGVTRIILDLRGNLGGYVDQAVDICQDIVPAGPIYYYLNSEGTDVGATSELKTPPFSKIAVLTDSNTASAAELMAAALKDSGATVIGTTTYGKGVMQTVMQLPTGDTYKFTFQEYLGRDKEKINKVGVKPNIAMDYPEFFSQPLELSNNMTSADVPNLKSALAYLKYKPGSAAGSNAVKYDSDTENALKRFQNDNKLNATGYPDVQTLLMINHVLLTALSADNSEMDAALKVVQ